MSSQYTIHCYAGAPSVYKSLVAGKFGGVSINYPQNFQFGTDNKTPEFLKKNPLGQVPVLDAPEGPIFESNAISRYIARVGSAAPQLLGKSAYEQVGNKVTCLTLQSVIDQWIEFNNDFFSNTYAMWSYLEGWGTYNKEKSDATKASLQKAFAALETSLKNKFLVNDTVTLADITIACSLLNPLKLVLDKEFRSPFPKTEAYLASLYAVPQFKEVVGDVVFIEKYTPPSN